MDHCDECRYWTESRVASGVGQCALRLRHLAVELSTSGDEECSVGAVVTKASYSCKEWTAHARYRVRFAFPVHNRVKATLLLLEDLKRECERATMFDVDVVVYDDGTDEDMSKVVDVARREGWQIVRLEDGPHGKQRYWQVVTQMFEDCRHLHRNTFFVMVANDYRLCTNFFERALNAWDSIADERKAALNLLADRTRDDIAQWTGFPPERHNDLVWKTQWNDGVLWCPMATLKALDFSIPSPPASRWNSRGISSGVWSYFSQELNRRGFGLYRVHQSLTVHAHWPSTMHSPEMRRAQPIVAQRFVDGDGACAKLTARGDRIIASLAAVPSREAQLKRTLESLVPQVNALRIYLDGWEQVPEWLLWDERLRTSGVDVTIQQPLVAGVGDAGKFCGPSEERGYHLVCDDDLIYPEDWALMCVEAIERYGRRAVVGVHGVFMNQTPVSSYFRDRKVMHWSAPVAEDTPVHLLGTGAMAFHSETVPWMSMDLFEKPNMADIWMGLACQRHRVPMVCVAHRHEVLTMQPCPWTLFDRFKNNDADQTEAVNRVQWVVNDPRMVSR